MQFVDEQDDLAFSLGDLFENCFEAILKLTPVLRACNERGKVQGNQSLGFQHVRYVAGNDPLSQPLNNRGLTDAGFPDENGVVLRAPGKNLHHASNFLVATDHRIQFGTARQVGQIPCIFLQCRIRLFRIL